MNIRARQVPMIAATALLTAASAAAQTTSPPEGGTLPPMTAPAMDVPMHVPQPPRDSDAAQPNAPPTPPPAPPKTKSAPAAQPPPVAAAPRGATITPIAPLCRDATYRVSIDGRPEMAHARVCRMADGTWRLAP